MSYLTDRKRAQGTGSSRGGTHHHWQMMGSSLALVFLVPLFIFTFGFGFGESHADVLAYFSRPFPAVITGLSLFVIIIHLMREAQDAILDYMHGSAQKVALFCVAGLSYTLIAAGLFALVTLAL
jgi:succinate dehydrogenase / fumarate reductase membrane anchor subunit